MDVAVLRFPNEERSRDLLRSRAVPRLLLVADGTTPPSCPDVLEDWIWQSAPVEDRAHRAAVLAARAGARPITPRIDDAGALRFHGRVQFLSPTEARLAAQLVGHFDRVVSRAALTRAAWPTVTPRARTLDTHILRLRRRVEPLDLEIATIRAQGWVMRPAADPWERVAAVAASVA